MIKPKLFTPPLAENSSHGSSYIKRFESTRAFEFALMRESFISKIALDFCSLMRCLKEKILLSRIKSLGVIQLLNKLDGKQFTQEDVKKLNEVIEYFIDFVENSIARKS